MFSKAMNLRVIGGILLACLLVLICGVCRTDDTAGGIAKAEAAEAAAQPENTEAPDQPQETEGSGTEEESANFAVGYVRVNSPTTKGWLPLPEEEDYVFPLRQINGEGEEVVNNIHVTPTGVYMESASCENQDCVLQGEVTLENKDTRVLENMIICLPNQVFLELYSTEELLAFSAEGEGASP